MAGVCIDLFTCWGPPAIVQFDNARENLGIAARANRRVEDEGVEAGADEGEDGDEDEEERAVPGPSGRKRGRTEAEVPAPDPPPEDEATEYESAPVFLSDGECEQVVARVSEFRSDLGSDVRSDPRSDASSDLI